MNVSALSNRSKMDHITPSSSTTVAGATSAGVMENGAQLKLASPAWRRLGNWQDQTT